MTLDTTELFATTKIVITAAEDTEVELYIPNKDNLPVALKKGTKLTIVSSSAGEIFHYLVQKSDKLTIATPEEVKEAAAAAA